MQKFSSNSATNYGAAIYSFDNSHIIFKGNSNVTFNSNSPGFITSYHDRYYYYAHLLGIIYIAKHAYIIFEGYATTVFSDNTADYGGAILCIDNSYVSFKGNSETMFNNNTARIGGAIRSKYDSYISFEGNSTTVFSNNTADYGGAIDSFYNSHISFQGNSTITFNSNTADYGGAIISVENSFISFQGFSTITFNNNTADYGGAITSVFNSYTSFTENSTTVFSNNIAAHHGAALYAIFNSDITFDNNSVITFTNNKSTNGTTIYSARYSKIMARGDSSVIFNDVSAKWCNNACLPNTDNYQDINSIDSNGIIMCSHQEGFICQLNKRKCNCSEFSRDFRNNSVIKITDTVILSSTASFKNLYNISIIGHNNPFVYCINGSGLTSLHSKNIVVKGITWIGCGNNTKIDDSESSNLPSEISLNFSNSTHSSDKNSVPVIHLQFSLNVSIQNCSFLYSEGPAIVLSKVSGETDITHCKFVNSGSYSDHGAAIRYTINDTANSLFTISNCSFAYNNFAKSLVYIENRIYMQSHKIIIHNSNFHHNQVVSIHVVNQNLTLSGNISFWNNNAREGSGIYITDSSVVIFGENSNVSFIQNAADKGGGSIILLRNNSTVLFDQNCETAFNDNKATKGTIYSESSSKVVFKATSRVTFSSNSATQYGDAISSLDNSQIKFTGNSNTVFHDNIAHLSNKNKQLGATVFCENNSHVLFEGDSTTIFSANTANFGAAILLFYNSEINFKDRSSATFNNNTAINGGAVALYDNCTATIEQFSNLTFSNNAASQCGGALYFSNNSNIIFTGNSVALFTYNRAGDYGGAICFNMSSSIKFEENSSANFINNTASFGETTYSKGNSAIILRKTSNLQINNNTARWNYGGQFTNKSNDIIIDDNGTIRCSDHTEYYVCQYKNCFCKNLEDISSNSVVIITDSIKLSSPIHLTELVNISLLGYNSPSVYCESDGGFQFTSCSNVSIANISWHKFSNKVSTTNNITPQIKFYSSSNVTIDNCIFQLSVGQAIVLSEVLGIVSIKHSKFVNNMHSHAKIQHGNAIHYSSSNETESSEDQLTIIISNCNFTDSVGIASLVYLEQHNNSSQCKSIIFQDSIFDNNQGTCIYLSNQNLYIKGNVVFKNNEAENGAGISINDRSTVTFSNASNVTFAQNTATSGGAIYSQSSSNVMFKETSKVTFSSNSATQYGTAISSFDNSQVKFTGNSKTIFNDNFIHLSNTNKQLGATIFCENNSHVLFEENSTVMFNASTANFGAAIFLHQKSNINFKDRSRVTFNNNTAISGGAVALYDNCTATIEQFSNLTFSNNNASQCGGALYFSNNSNILFTDNSVTSFTDNRAGDYGGAICYNMSSSIKFEENSSANFINNTASFGETTYSKGNSVIILRKTLNLMINNNTARWNYGGQFTNKSNDIIIDDDGIVRCSDHTEYYVCQYKNCFCKNLNDIPSNSVVMITDNITLSSPIQLTKLVNVSLIGYNSPSIYCENDGGLQFTSCTNVTIINITWHRLINNDRNIPEKIKFYNSSIITIDHCTFQQSVGQAIVLSEVSGDVNIKHCKFMNNIYSHRGHGAAIHYTSNCTEFTKEQLTISDCNFTANFGIASLIYLEQLTSNSNLCESVTLKNSKLDNNKGVCIYLSNQNFHIEGNVLFDNNEAQNGAGIFISDHSKLTIDEASNVVFVHNTATINGGAIYVNNYSSVVFENNVHANFTSNKAMESGGTIYSYNKSGISLKGNSIVLFANSNARFGGTFYAENNSFIKTNGTTNLTITNSEAMYGGAIYIKQNSEMTVTENSTTEFLSNEAKEDGGSIYSNSHSNITFSNNSVSNIHNSRAVKGGAIYCYNNSNIILDEKSTVWLNHSTAAELGGTMYIENDGYIITKGISNLAICNSEATNGGASYLMHNSSMMITENSTITFLNNKALEDGGGIYFKYNSSIMFMGNSTIKITSNSASRGGAMFSKGTSNVYFHNNSIAVFNMNEATQNGGCIYTDQSNIQIKGTCNVTFNNSVVFGGAGGAIFCRGNSSISLDSCNVTFYNNTVYNGEGGAIYCTNSIAIFKGTSNVEFHSNKATDGGAADFNVNSSLIISSNSNVSFINNSATMGGAVNFHVNSNGMFDMNSIVVLKHNIAFQNGGAFHLAVHCDIEFKKFINAEFDNNKAERGAAIFIMMDSESTFKNFSTIMFKNNTASQDGGAIHIGDESRLIIMQDSNVTFSHNRANDYGGAMYNEGKINFHNSTNISFLHNSANIGCSVYINLLAQCNNTCLNNRVLGITTTNDYHTTHIITSPSKIELHTSNIHRVNNTDLECNSYYIQNIMLGQKILLDACLYDYYHQQIDAAQFLISGTDSNGYHFDPDNTLITCNHTIELVSIYGNKTAQFNYSITLSLYDNRQSESKEVMVNLIIGLSPCHPGFLYDKKSQKCECYNASDIVFCSGSSSTIKRGYWFGNVTDKPTVTFCPINYCNFTCCETSDGYYHLSPVRDNQCRSYRSGTACGSCTVGYTLSFDSTECVNTKNCTAGHTVSVTLLTIIYWIVMVTLVFALMHYKVEIGYLYGITYYYSIVDILLNQNLYASKGFYLTVTIMSSFSKIIPQFLGELCLSTGLSGIDQQFIHYIHPLAIIVILGIISLSARISQRISVIISRGIIHVICLLLLLSYTSIASTSLLLMRPLMFHEINNVYTYLSPNIEYFHDRHLVYGIVALLCTVSIAIGLPLLLTLEPFLNSKFNFTKIKPLLDQFQGCYKDKYRCFAGYYMICRLVIITIVITDSSNDFVAKYLLIITCGIIALVHLLIKPYNSVMLNKLDGIILQLIIFTEALSLFDDYDSPLVITFSFVLVILPFLIIISITIFLHKVDIKKLFIYFASKITSHAPNSNDITNNEIPMKEYNLVIGNTLRSNATICDM